MKKGMKKISHFLIRVPMFGNQTAKEMESFFADLHRQLLSHRGHKEEKIVSLEITFVNRFVHFLPPFIAKNAITISALAIIATIIICCRLNPKTTSVSGKYLQVSVSAS